MRWLWREEKGSLHCVVSPLFYLAQWCHVLHSVFTVVCVFLQLFIVLHVRGHLIFSLLAPSSQCVLYIVHSIDDMCPTCVQCGSVVTSQALL